MLVYSNQVVHVISTNVLGYASVRQLPRGEGLEFASPFIFSIGVIS